MSTTVNLFMSPLPTAWRKVTSITPAGSAPVRCLTLEDPRGLYITTDGIVTHNSPAKGSLTIGENAAPWKYHDTPDAFSDSQAGRDLLARLREADGKDRKITAVALDHRSPIASVVSAFERAFNKRVVFVKGLSSNGLILDDAPGVVFANVEGENPVGFVLGTELREQASAWTDDLPPAQELGELFDSRGEWSSLSEDNADGTPSQRHVVARVANQMLGAMGMDQGLISDVLATYLRSGTFEERAEKMIDDAQLSTMLGDAPPRANLLESKINLSFDGPDVIMNDQANAELTYYIRERLSATRDVVKHLGGGFSEDISAVGGTARVRRQGENFILHASVASLSKAVRASGRGVLTDAKAAADAIIEEELLHLAGLSFMREEWRANPRGLTFDEYFTNEIESIWAQIHRESFGNPEVKAAAVAAWNIYAHSGIPKAESFRDVAAHMQSNPDLREKMIFEMSRQMAQLWRSGRISESATEPTGWWNKLKAWLSGALRTLHRAAASLKEGRWGSLLAQHAQNSLDMLAEAESGRTVGTQGNRNGAQITFEAKIKNINPRHSEGEPFRNQNLGARAVITGSPLPAQLRGVLDQTGRTQAMMNEGIASMKKDLEAALLEQAKRNGTDFRTEALAIAPALVDDGQYGPGAGAAALARSTPAVQEAVRRSRNLIDQLSIYTANIVRAAGNVELANTMMLNQGAWLKRYYAAFDPKANWTYENLVELAARGGQTTNGSDAATILNDARRWFRNEYPTLTLNEINMRIAQLMNRDEFSASVMGQRPSGKDGEGKINSDVSSFQRRGDIPAEIRAVMGEETNPLMRFAKSGEFLTQFIARHETQQVMLALGMASGLFSATPDPIVYKATMPVDNLAWSGFIQPLQPNGSRAEIYTTSELMQALQDTYATSDLRGDGLSGFMLNLMDLLAPLAREAKWNKVVGNPDSWAVNLIGGLIGAVQTGAVMSPHWRDAWNLMTSGKSLTDGEMAMAGIAQGQSQAIIATLTPQQLEEMRSAAAKLESRQLRNRLAGAGVTSQQYHLADIDNLSGVHEARLFQALEAFDAWNAIKGAGRGAFTGYVMLQGFGKVPATIAAAIGGVAGGFIGGERIESARQWIAEKLIGKPDLFWKLLDFSDNYAAHLAAGDTEAVAFQAAILKTLNSLPNYARTPAILQAMSKLGISSSFVGFQAEVWRNTFYQPIIAAREIASGRGPLMRRGIRRLAGTAAVAVGANFVVQSAAMALMKVLGLGDGEDDEAKRKAFQRSLAAPWDKNAILAFANLDPDKVTWMNTNYLVPQLAIGNVVRAFLSGWDEDRAMSSASKELWQQFMGGSVFLDPAIEALSGKRKSTGADISDEDEDTWAKKVDLTMHFLTAIYAPGAADKADRIARAINDRPRNDRIFSLNEEMARFMGLRSFTRPTVNLAESAFKKIGADSRKIEASAGKAIGNNPVDKEAKLDDYRQRVSALRERVETLESDLSTIGFSDAEIKKLRTDTIGMGEAVFEIKADTDERKAREKEAKALR